MYSAGLGCKQMCGFEWHWALVTWAWNGKMIHLFSAAEYIILNEQHGFKYLPPLPGLWVVLSVLSFAQQVWEYQGFEWTRARGSGIPERVHHPEVPAVSHGAKRAWAQAPRRVQAVDTNHGEGLHRSVWRSVETNPDDSILIFKSCRNHAS